MVVVTPANPSSKLPFIADGFIATLLVFRKSEIYFNQNLIIFV